MLKCENISKIYNDNSWFSKKESIKVLENISFHLKQGRSMGFAGRNGAGKSTLMRIILGLEKATEGSVLFMEKNIHGLKYNELKKIYKDMQVVFQDPQSSMNHQYTVYDVIKEPVENYYSYAKDEMKNIVLKLLSAVRLSEDKLYKNIMHLSGGEQQMLAMGRALMSQPRIILMDEPSMGLSPILVNQIFDIIEEVSKGGTTVLLVEQNAKKALSIADRAYVLETGNIVLEGNAKELISDDSIRKAYLGE